MTNFNVKSQAAAYVDGYQNGLADLNAIIQNGGDLADVQEWINNNRMPARADMFEARAAEFRS